MKLLPLFFTAFFGLILVYACSKDEGNSSNTTHFKFTSSTAQAITSR